LYYVFLEINVNADAENSDVEPECDNFDDEKFDDEIQRYWNFLLYSVLQIKLILLNVVSCL